MSRPRSRTPLATAAMITARSVAPGSGMTIISPFSATKKKPPPHSVTPYRSDDLLMFQRSMV